MAAIGKAQPTNADIQKASLARCSWKWGDIVGPSEGGATITRERRSSGNKRQSSSYFLPPPFFFLFFFSFFVFHFWWYLFMPRACMTKGVTKFQGLSHTTLFGCKRSDYQMGYDGTGLWTGKRRKRRILLKKKKN